MTPYTIGFDVGGTRLKSGGCDAAGEASAQQVSVLPEPTRARSAAEIADRRSGKNIAKQPKAKPHSIGLALPRRCSPQPRSVWHCLES